MAKVSDDDMALMGRLLGRGEAGEKGAARIAALLDALNESESKLGEVQSAYDAVLKRMHEEHEIRIDLGNRLDETQRQLADRIEHHAEAVKHCNELAAQLDTIKLQAANATEYVLAQINADLQSRLNALTEAVTHYLDNVSTDDGAAYEDVVRLRKLTVVEKPCTCHPDDNPPRPCPRKYALTECRKAAACE